MGCSPSKGQLFTGIYNRQALPFGSGVINSDHFGVETEIKSQTETEITSGGLRLSQEENTTVQTQGKKPTVCDIVWGSVNIGETQLHLREEKLSKESTEGKDERRIENNGCERSRQIDRLRETDYMQSNLDPIQAIVKAHEAAYAYMAHNIPKYESLLGLLEKATQTQLSLQPMMTLLALQYEEINQALEDIATEGEQMLTTYRSYRDLPEAHGDVPLNPAILKAERNSRTDSSPNPLRHMLHQLIPKMRLVWDSVKELGDTSLKETSDYFNLLSQSLAGKLVAKSAADLRLKQVLICVESFALRNLDSEDTALPSEDSGIGVENECYNGSVRCCSQQECSGPGVTGQSIYGCAAGSLPDQACFNAADDAGKDIDAQDIYDDEEPKHERRRKSKSTDQNMSNWYQEESSRCPLQVDLQSKKPTNSTFEQSDPNDKTIRRLKSADDSSESSVRKDTPAHFLGVRRSRSAECLCERVNDDMVQGNDRTNRNQKPEWITKRSNLLQSCCRRDGNNGPVKPGLIPPSLTPAVAPVPPGKDAVRRLINTFSQMDCDGSNRQPLIGPTRFKVKKKTLLPLISKCKASVSASGNNITTIDQQFSVRPYDADANSLPPPPPEVLMDNSFEKKKDGKDYGGKTQTTKCYATHGLKASMQAVLLPSQDTLDISETSANGQDFMNETNQRQVGDKVKDETISLWQHSQIINHMSHCTETVMKLGPGDECDKSLAENREETVGIANRDLGEGEASTLYANSCRATTPKVSRPRIPPSSYSTCHNVSSPTALLSPSSGPVSVQAETSKASITLQIQRCSKKDGANENALSFYDARYVVGQENQSAIRSVKPSCKSTLPRPWGEPKSASESLKATCLPQTIRRSIPNRSTLTPQCQDSDSLNNVRKADLSETAQCSDIPLRFSVSGSQEAEAKITDKRD